MTALALTAVAVAAAPSRPQPPAAAPSRPAISITGDVSGLYPGAAKRVRLRARNRSHRARTVTAVRARALDAGPGCPAANLRTRVRRVRLRIPPGSQRRLGYRIAMVPNAADGCQDARFPIRYRARVR